MSLGVGLERELGDEFGVEFDESDEFDEVGGPFSVCLLHSEMGLMSLEMFLVSLGVGLERELGDEFGVVFVG